MTATERLAGPVLVYDGGCRFCTRAAERVARSFPQGSNATARSFQELGPEGLAQFGLTRDDVEGAAWWVTPEGRRLRGERAMTASLAQGEGLVGILGRVSDLAVLRPLAGLIYRLIARNRSRLSGSLGSRSLD